MQARNAPMHVSSVWVFVCQGCHTPHPIGIYTHRRCCKWLLRMLCVGKPATEPVRGFAGITSLQRNMLCSGRCTSYKRRDLRCDISLPLRMTGYYGQKLRRAPHTVLGSRTVSNLSYHLAQSPGSALLFPQTTRSYPLGETLPLRLAQYPLP